MTEQRRHSAERVSSGWQITGENHIHEYNTLINVFDNEYRIVMAHLEELMQVNSCEVETIVSVRSLIDTTNRVIRIWSIGII